MDKGRILRLFKSLCNQAITQPNTFDVDVGVWILEILSIWCARLYPTQPTVGRMAIYAELANIILRWTGKNDSVALVRELAEMLERLEGEIGEMASMILAECTPEIVYGIQIGKSPVDNQTYT